MIRTANGLRTPSARSGSHFGLPRRSEPQRTERSGRSTTKTSDHSPNGAVGSYFGVSLIKQGQHLSKLVSFTGHERKDRVDGVVPNYRVGPPDLLDPGVFDRIKRSRRNGDRTASRIPQGDGPQPPRDALRERVRPEGGQ